MATSVFVPTASTIPSDTPLRSPSSLSVSSSTTSSNPVAVRRGPGGKVCDTCHEGRAILQRPATGQKVCKPCFLSAFEEEVHQTIIREQLFRAGDRIAIGASGGKDSTVLAYVLHKLNKKYSYGVDLVLVSVDEGIQGYRDASLERVKDTSEELQVPLRIISYQELFGWPMDRVVTQTGGRNSCSYCGVFRRQALDKGSVLTGSDKIAIGHNADDVAETALMNLLRGDIARLGRCVKAITGGDSDNTNTTMLKGSNDDILDSFGKGGPLPRVKPLITCYEKEIVAYAHHAKLPYHATECSYSPAAYRGFLREMIKDLEAIRPSIIRDIIRAANFWQVDENGLGSVPSSNTTTVSLLPNDTPTNNNDDNVSVSSHHTRTTTLTTTTQYSTTGNGHHKLMMKQRIAGTCIRCGYLSSSTLCQACNLLIGLEAGNPRLGLTGGSGGGGSYGSKGELSVSERAKQHLIQLKQQQQKQQQQQEGQGRLLLDSVPEKKGCCGSSSRNGNEEDGGHGKNGTGTSCCNGKGRCGASTEKAVGTLSSELPTTNKTECCKNGSDGCMTTNSGPCHG